MAERSGVTYCDVGADQNKGHFYHDGRFPTLLDTVKSYNDRFNLALSDQEERDLLEYLKSL